MSRNLSQGKKKEKYIYRYVFIHMYICDIYTLYFFKILLFLFLEGGERREKEKERNTDGREKHLLVASHMPPTWALARNPGMRPN